MRSNEAWGDSPLELVVHDRDPRELERRVRFLTTCFQDARINAYSRRGELLDHIAKLPRHAPGRRWPLALIDLVHARLTTPGERLFQTIVEHPALNDRVAPVAFTLFGHDGTKGVLQALGVRAILTPEELERGPERVQQARESLQLIAAGSDKLIRIGEPPRDDDDLRLVQRLTELFPSLGDDYRDGSAEQWAQAMGIVLICRLFSEHYSQESVMEQLGIKRPVLDRLRKELETNRRGIAARAFPSGGETADLGAVIDALEPFLGRSKALWETMRPTKLDGAARIKRIASLVEDLFPPDLDQPPESFPRDLQPWIPPEYVPWLREFTASYVDLRAGRKGDSTPQVDAAIGVVARQFDIPRERARHGIVHAVMCLEDAIADSDQPPTQS